MAYRMPDRCGGAVTVYNPEVVCEEEIGKLRPNKAIVVCGVPATEPSRMTINVQGDDKDDIAFHFDVRFNYGNSNEVIVRNAKEGGSWGPEERDLEIDFPFKGDEPFEVAMIVDDDKYTVSLNGRYLLEFKHRLCELHKFDRVVVSGDVTLCKVESFCATLPVYNPPVPYEENIGRLYKNQKILIAGIPNPGANRMTFNLQNDDAIAFHFDVRFDYGNSTDVIVRNTKQGSWGHEERELNCFPFASEKYFEIEITVKKNKYKVDFNGKKLLVYSHRALPFQDFDTLTVTGDVRLLKVKY